MSKQIVLDVRGTEIGANHFETVGFPAYTRGLVTDVLGKFRAVPYWTALDVFNLLPAASATAGKDDLLISLGTSTEVIARSAKGGVNVKTQASSPADNDNAMLIPVSGSAQIVPITAVSRIRFSTRVVLTQITKLVFGAGLDENFTSPIPNATAGDGCAFYFDPDAEVDTGLTDATANWILTEKVNGTDTFLDSGVPVQAGKGYDLAIEIGEDLKPVYFIDGVQVGIGASALTSGDSVGPVIGVQANGTPDAQSDFDVRYVMVERQIG